MIKLRFKRVITSSTRLKMNAYPAYNTRILAIIITNTITNNILTLVSQILCRFNCFVASSQGSSTQTTEKKQMEISTYMYLNKFKEKAVPKTRLYIIPVKKEHYIIEVHVISSMKVFVKFQQNLGIQDLEN